MDRFCGGESSGVAPIQHLHHRRMDIESCYQARSTQKKSSSLPKLSWIHYMPIRADEHMAGHERMQAVVNNESDYGIFPSDVVMRSISAASEPFRPDQLREPSMADNFETESQILQQNVENSIRESLCAVLGAFLLLFPSYGESLWERRR